MISEHLCFPQDWIGETPQKINDYTFQIGNNSARQVSIPSGYGKVRNAYWIPDGVLVLCPETDDIKFFFVGHRRYFIAYSNESAPHEIQAYKAAVEECKLLRGQANNNVASRKTTNERKSSNSSKSGSSKHRESLGNTIRRVKASINTFSKVDDSSEFEADANQIVNDYLKQQQNWMAEADRQYRERDRILQKLFGMRDAELHKLRQIDRNIIAKTNKRNIFKNLETIFKKGAIGLLDTDQISKYIGVKSADGKRAVARIEEEYLRSIRTEGLSEKFILCWSEIFYLIEEGIHFNSNLELISKLISKECGGSNVLGLEPDDNFEGFLKYLYSNVPYAYWGYDLEKLPYEDKVKARIDYLTTWIPSDDEQYRYDPELLEVLSDKEIADGDDKDDIDDDDVDDCANECNNRKNCIYKEPRKAPNKNFFPELNEKFKAENIEDESIKPSGFFDFATRNRNRRVESLKGKRRDLQEEIEDNKKSIRKSLISILKLTEKLLEKEHALNVLKDTPIKTNRDKERLEDKIETLEDKIESIKDDIESSNEDVRDYYKELQSCVNKYNKINKELLGLTSSSKYDEEYSLEGPGINIAMSISKNIKLKDSESLSLLFEEYINH